MNRETIAEAIFKAIAEREGYANNAFSDMPAAVKDNYYAAAEALDAAGLLGTVTGHSDAALGAAKDASYAEGFEAGKASVVVEPAANGEAGNTAVEEPQA